ncbi:MAG: hypothetical protein XXXJIFNMEKO3_LKCDNKCA_00161 (plasmid) [Candidatus Erwinia impunctatus]
MVTMFNPLPPAPHLAGSSPVLRDVSVTVTMLRGASKAA